MTDGGNVYSGHDVDWNYCGALRLIVLLVIVVVDGTSVGMDLYTLVHIIGIPADSSISKFFMNLQNYI